MSRLQSAVWRHLIIIAGFLGVALLITFPAVLTLPTQFIGSETGDTYEMARNIWSLAYALRQGEPLFYDTLLGYPDGISGLIFMTVPLQHFPAAFYALVMPLPLAYNVHVLLWMALNGWAMAWLMRYLLDADTILSVPALLAGLVYMTFPLFQGHLAEGHGGLMMGWGAPLYVWAVFNLIDAETDAWRWLIAGVFFFYLSTTGHILQAIYVLLPLSGMVWLTQLYKRNWRALGRVTLMGVLAAGMLLLVYLPAIRESLTETAYVDTTGYVRYSADALAVVSPSFFNPIFDALLEYPRAVIGTNLGEGVLYLGVVVSGLCLAGLLTNRDARWWALLGVVAWVLSLGTLLKVMDTPVQLQLGEYSTYIPLPFAFVQNLPGFNLARTPARFGFTLALAIAVLAGYGATWLWQQRTRWQLPRWASASMIGLLALVILFEYQVFWAMPTLPGGIPAPIANLRQRDDVRAVFNVPHEHLLGAKEALFLQTGHQQPLIAGQLTRQTPVNPAKLAILQQTLNRSMLDAAGADVLIVHKQRTAEVGLSFEAHLSTWESPLYESSEYAVYDIPDPTPDADVQPIALDREGRWQPLADTLDVPVYAPEPTWARVHIVAATNGRSFSAALDGQRLHAWRTPDNGSIIVLPVALRDPGYHTLSLALDDPCPAHYDPALRCNSDVQTRVEFVEISPREPATFDERITLTAGTVAGDEVWLQWQFEDVIPETDVRFVHVVDAEGNLIWQDDTPLGTFEAGAQWAETVRIPTDELSAGEYTVRVGWYDVQTVTNYRTSDGEEAQVLGALTVD